MKTTYTNSRYFAVISISMVLIASTIELNAQDRKSDRRDRERNNTEYQNTYRKNDRTTVDHKRASYESNYDNSGYKRKYNPKSHKSYYSHKVKHEKVNYFNHPKHGRVYHHFDHNPVVFHHSGGNYYYSGNHFYTYRNGIGYCAVEAPRNVYFRSLPLHCERVYVNGHVLYRNGDLFFQLSPRGYSVVPSPFEIRFSARF